MSLESIIIHYPIVEALVPHLTSRDFVHLSEVNSTFRKELKGLERPADTETITGSSLSACSCRKSPEECCPRHGTRRLRNLLRRTDRVCQDACHIDRSAALADDNSQDWMRRIRQELGGMSDAHPCWECRRLVCFPCWWAANVGNYLNMRGGPRSQPVCQRCWGKELTELHEDQPQRFGSLLPSCASWSVAEQQNQFCTCGPVVFCSTCSSKICPTKAHAPAKVSRYALFECRFCSHRISLSDMAPFYLKANFYCHFCILPMRMQTLSSQHHEHFIPEFDIYIKPQDIPSLFSARSQFLVEDPLSERRIILVKREVRDFRSRQRLPNFRLDGHYVCNEEYWKATSRQWCRMVGLTDGEGNVGFSGAAHTWVFWLPTEIRYRPSPLAVDYYPVSLYASPQPVRWRRPPCPPIWYIWETVPFRKFQEKVKALTESRPDSFGALVMGATAALWYLGFRLLEDK